MNLDQATRVYMHLKQSACADLVDALFAAAVTYARLRTDWVLSPIERRKELDAMRTRAHNAFIDCCNILSRNMAKAGENIEWRREVGDERKMIGDLACLLHCVMGVQVRLAWHGAEP